MSISYALPVVLQIPFLLYCPQKGVLVLLPVVVVIGNMSVGSSSSFIAIKRRKD